MKSKNICIEYDGEHHFCDRNTFGGINKLNDIQKKDLIKENFCYNKNIQLFRIRYDDDIIEKLKEYLYIK